MQAVVPRRCSLLRLLRLRRSRHPPRPWVEARSPFSKKTSEPGRESHGVVAGRRAAHEICLEQCRVGISRFQGNIHLREPVSDNVLPASQEVRVRSHLDTEISVSMRVTDATEDLPSPPPKIRIKPRKTPTRSSRRFAKNAIVGFKYQGKRADVCPGDVKS